MQFKYTMTEQCQLPSVLVREEIISARIQWDNRVRQRPLIVQQLAQSLGISTDMSRRMLDERDVCSADFEFWDLVCFKAYEETKTVEWGARDIINAMLNVIRSHVACNAGIMAHLDKKSAPGVHATIEHLSANGLVQIIQRQLPNLDWVYNTPSSQERYVKRLVQEWNSKRMYPDANTQLKTGKMAEWFMERYSLQSVHEQVYPDCPMYQ